MPSCTARWADDKTKDKITVSDCTSIASLKAKLALHLPNVFGPHVTILSSAKISAVVLDDTPAKLRGKAPKKCYFRTRTPEHYPNLNAEEWHDILFFHAALADDSPGVSLAVAQIKQRDVGVPESLCQASAVLGQFVFNTICAVGDTPKGDNDVTRRTLDHILRATAKCDVNPDVCTFASHTSGESLLHVCVLCNRGDLLPMLVDRKADIGARDHKGQTVIHTAVNSDHAASLIPDVVAAGADVSATDSLARTPVFVAAERNDLKVLRVLVEEYDAECANGDSLGRTPLAVSVQNGSLECVEFLLMRKAAVNPTMSAPRAPLVLAAKRGDQALLSRLLDCKADINGVDADGISALHASTGANSVSCVRVLLMDAACQVDELTPNDFSLRTPLLSYLARQGESIDFALITALVDRKADVNRVDSQGGFPLLYAVEMHRSSVVTGVLLRARANVEQTYVNAQTALFFASAGTRSASVKPAALLEAASAEDKLTRVLLEARANAATHDVLGWTPLMFALQRSTCPRVVVSMLLAAKASADSMSVSRNSTVLRLAIQRKNAPVLRALVAAKADVNAMDAHGGFPLLFATSGCEDDGEMVQVLLEANASVHSAYRGHMPIFFAAAHGHARTLTLLLAHRADAVGVDMHNVNPLMMACMSGNEDCVQTLLGAQASVNVTDDNQAAPLQIAANWGHGVVCTILLAAKASIDGRAKDGTASPSALTPLLGALRMGHNDAALALLHTSTTPPPNVRAVDASGRTPLGLAMTCANPPAAEVVRDLCRLQCDVGAPITDGDNALFVSVRRDAHEVMCVLIEAAADVNAKDSNGHAALFVAIVSGARQMVCALLGARADVNVKDMTGNPLLCVAASKNYGEGRKCTTDAQRQLRTCATASTEWKHAVPECRGAEDEYGEIVHALVEGGADVNAVDSGGDTPLVLATRQNFGEIVQVLLRCPTLDAVNSHSIALLLASTEGYHAICTCLLRAGALVNQQDPATGNTPLIVACAGHHVAVVETLLAHRADPHVINADGLTALVMARNSSHITYLLRHPPRTPPCTNDAPWTTSQGERNVEKKASWWKTLFSWKKKKKTKDGTGATHALLTADSFTETAVRASPTAPSRDGEAA